MLFIYSLLLYLLTPYLFIRLWIKSFSLPSYKQRISERFALNKAPEKQIDIWLHAVSLGEIIAATPLINACLNKNWHILITTMTPTGSEFVQKKWHSQVHHQYVPYDLPGVVKRFFSKTKPKIGIIMETELWPNLIHYSHKAQIPVYLINARLSERSLKGYLRARFFFKPLLNELTAILAQSPEDAKRFIRLGVKPQQVQVCGNIKFDLQHYDDAPNQTLVLKTHWGSARTVVIFASTHDGEEITLLHHLKTLQKAIPKVIVLIAPRHPERFKSVYQTCILQGFNTGLRSQIASLSIDNEIVVLDSMGELMRFYEISDYAFVGGSLLPIGGHNILEPIAVNVPVISGSHTHNFKTICSDLVHEKALIVVNNAAQVIDAIIALDQNKAARTAQVAQASQVLMRNKGALTCYLDKITQVLMHNQEQK